MFSINFNVSNPERAGAGRVRGGHQVRADAGRAGGQRAERRQAVPAPQSVSSDSYKYPPYIQHFPEVNIYFEGLLVPSVKLKSELY